jgi:hypothetical protein
MLDEKDRQLKRGWNLIVENQMKGGDPCWDGYEMVGKKEKDGKEVPNCVPKESQEHILDEAYEFEDDSDEITLEGDVHGILDEDVINEAEYQGRKVKLNKPMRGDVKKFKVYVKDPKTGNVKKVNFGDPNMKIKKSNPERRKSFRARHNCDNPGPKTKARYWSCRMWESVDHLKEEPERIEGINRKSPINNKQEVGYNSTSICAAGGTPPGDSDHKNCVLNVQDSFDDPEGRKEKRKSKSINEMERTRPVKDTIDFDPKSSDGVDVDSPPKAAKAKEKTDKAGVGPKGKTGLGEPAKDVLQNFNDIVLGQSGSMEEDSIPGGKADDMTLEQIAQIHSVDVDALQTELDKGIEHELEHTDDRLIATEIAMDHLYEDPEYYTKLDQIEHSEELNEDEDQEFVIIHDAEDTAEKLISAYEEDDETSPMEAIEEMRSDIAELESKAGQISSTFQNKMSIWNDSWNNANRSGKSGRAVTSSIGSHNMPFNNFEEAIQIYLMPDEEKDEKLLDILGFSGMTNLINKRQYPKRKVNEAQDRRPGPRQQEYEFDALRNPSKRGGTSHTSKKMTGSPFIRDDIIRSALFGKSEKDAMGLLEKITSKLENNEQVNWSDLVLIGRKMDGPAGKFLQFLFFDLPSNDNLVKEFKNLANLYQEKEKAKSLIDGRKLAIDHFKKKIESEKTDRDPLMEGARGWERFKRLRYRG